MFGLFFLVAPGKAKDEREASSLEPIWTLKASPTLLITIPIILSPLTGTYYTEGTNYTNIFNDLKANTQYIITLLQWQSIQ